MNPHLGGDESESVLPCEVDPDTWFAEGNSIEARLDVEYATSVCERCLSRYYTQCAHCEEYELDRDVVTVDGDSWCSACAEQDSSECAGCSDRFPDEDLVPTPYHADHPEHRHDDMLCGDCLDEARMEALYVRLENACEHLSPVRRVATRLLWSLVTNESLGAHCSPVSATA